MWVSASYPMRQISVYNILCSTLSYAQVLQMTDSFRDVWIYLKLRKPVSKLVFVYNYSWQRMYSRKGKEREVQYFLQSHALELCGTIYHFFHLPCSIFFFYINGNLQALFCKDRYKYDLSFLRVGRTPHNDQHHACTYRSEQVGICLLLRWFFFLLQINSCAFVNSQQWKKCGVFTIPYGCGYWNAGESTK